MGSFFTAERTYTHRRVHTQKAGLYMHPGPVEAPVHRIEIAIGKSVTGGCRRHVGMVGLAGGWWLTLCSMRLRGM